MTIYDRICGDAATGLKRFAVLIDPDKYTPASITPVIDRASNGAVDYFLMGGSLLMHDGQSQLIACIRERTTIPVILFPGNNMQLNKNADGILLLSLISGRNPDLLIGRHVISSPYLRASGLEIMPTGYMLVESGNTTSVTYMSNTTPIPAVKDEIAVCTAMAGEMLGLRILYLDAGSGARNPVPAKMIASVRKAIDIPLITGGGITSATLAKQAFDAGADIIVVGNAIEKNPELITDIASIIK
jgi:putative glycerol-1-phosphate prenyltransferase